MAQIQATVFDAAQMPQQWRSDGALFNTFGGFGSPISQGGGNGTMRAQGRLTQLLSPIELTELFVSSWLMAKVCEAGPKEMTRKWGISTSTKIASDVLVEYDKYISRTLKTPKEFREAQTWANLYGGAVIFMGINDGNPPETPVDKTKIESIDFLRVMDRYEVTPYFTSMAQIDYTNIEYFQTTGQQSLLLGADGYPIQTQGMIIHKSRILKFDGIDIPYRLRSINNGWGLSKLQRVYTDFWNFVNTLDNGAAIVARFDIFNHAIKGLSKMVETGKSGAIKAHMREVYEFLGQYGVLLTDGDVESAGFMNRDVGGLKDFLGPLQEVVTAASGMPFSILWGRIGRAGMGGTGQHDIEKKVWAETCHGDQESQFRDLVETEQEYVGLAKDGPMNGKGSEDIGFQFNPILDPDPGQELERKFKQAQIDQIYHQIQDPDGVTVLAAKEIRESRFGREEYNFETQIDPSMEFEDPLERQAQQLEMQQQFAPKPTVPAKKADDNTPVKRRLPFHNFTLGLQYQPFDKRHGRTLPVGYGHIEKTIGADKMAVDVYVGHDLSSPRIFQVTQLVNGEFDEHKYFVGFNDTADRIAELYKSIMPPEFFGGIEEMDVSHLENYRKPAKKADAIPIQVRGIPLDPGVLDPLADVYEADLADANRQWKDLPEQVVSKKWKKLLEPQKG